MSKIVLATGNKGKVQELSDMLSGSSASIISQAEFNVEEAEENGLSFIENALIKARNAARQTGLPAIADDSGLSVDALRGAPGIYSARYAEMANKGSGDVDNYAHLLEQLKDVADGDRGAQFNCVIAYVSHADDPIPFIAHGIWHGTILRAPQGENGFGYDPVFWVAEKNCSSAELDKKIKNEISHRGKALAELLPKLKHLGL